MQYRVAQQVADIGSKLVAEHHPHLNGVRVEFVFMDKTPKTKGKDTWGRAKKISGLNAFLSNSDDHESYGAAEDYFVVEVSEEVWQRLDAKSRKALVDHELSHCEIVMDEETGASGLSIVGHDVTEFDAILRRHGLWNESVEGFVKAGAEQLSLEDAGAPLTAVR